MIWNFIKLPPDGFWLVVIVVVDFVEVVLFHFSWEEAKSGVAESSGSGGFKGISHPTRGDDRRDGLFAAVVYMKIADLKAGRRRRITPIKLRLMGTRR